jgi:hypothetical protein
MANCACLGTIGEHFPRFVSELIWSYTAALTEGAVVDWLQKNQPKLSVPVRGGILPLRVYCQCYTWRGVTLNIILDTPILDVELEPLALARPTDIPAALQHLGPPEVRSLLSTARAGARHGEVELSASSVLKTAATARIVLSALRAIGKKMESQMTLHCVHAP